MLAFRASISFQYVTVHTYSLVQLDLVVVRTWLRELVLYSMSYMAGMVAISGAPSLTDVFDH